MKHASLLITLCVLFGFSAIAQTTATEKNSKRITITTKKVDENGKTVTETYIAEGDEPAKILETMAIDPESIQRVNVINPSKENEERLFLYRNAGDKVTIEGTLRENANENVNGEVREVEKIVIINKEQGKEGKECVKIYTHGGEAPARMWMRGSHESKSNCAALGVYVTTSERGGSRINSLIENGGAQASGMKAGDIIKSIEEFEVEDFATLHLALSHFRPGDVVTVRYDREGKSQKAKVELKDWRDLPGHEWRSRSDCGKEITQVEEEDKLALDEPDPLSNIQPLELQDAMIFPNPTEGVFAFSFTTVPGPLTVAITDVNGKVVYQDNNDNPEGFYKKDIDLKGLPQGNYIITVKQGEKIFTEQIAKQ